MKQKLQIFVLLFFIGTSIIAKQIDETTALQVGKNFLFATSNAQNLKSASNLQIEFKAVSNNISFSSSPQQTVLYYIINSSSDGFVIVAGDDNVSPILGYSDEGTFDPDKIPYNVAKWLEGYKNEIRYAIEQNVEADNEIIDEWKNLKCAKNITTSVSVSPLIKTKWSQSPYYNALCPGGSVTGCVATAMAQIMKYWSYPATGSGFHSYKHQSYGTLSANFGSTSYQWSSMPNSVTSKNNAVATLMYHAGVSVDMDYSPEGSSAYEICWDNAQNCSEYALKTYFGYRNTIQGLFKDDYSQSEWISLLKNELDSGRPILYGGDGYDGGHCFVADGYDSNNYIHFNWGWGGECDGYFRINTLNPDGYQYSNNQDAVIGIEPPSTSDSYSLELCDHINITYDELYYIEPFTVTTNILNYGGSEFKGDFSAAIFDESNNFVDFIQILSGYSLKAGYSYNNKITFSTNKDIGVISMLPGTYFIAIFYRPEGGNWIEVSDGANYINDKKITVINPNDIELDSEMKISSGTTITKGQPISVNLNVWNSGTTTFKGQYDLSLCNMDGTNAQIIDIINEDVGLPHNYCYSDPYLTFNSPSIDVEPGTYLLVAFFKPTNGVSQIVGSTDYHNPIKVTVVAPNLQPDMYESNNAITNSYNLPLVFSGNSASINTTGANCHITSDKDYYKIDFPPGYQYTITPHLQDSYNNFNDNSYSLDGMFSYSKDGNKWSDAFDNKMTADIVLNGSSTLYFCVAPYFIGQTGTYNLEMAITRSSSTGINNNEINANIKVYPNPAKDYVQIDFNEYYGEIDQLQLLNIQGQCVFSKNKIDRHKALNIPLINLADGIYLLQLQTNSGILTKKITISK